MGSCQYSFNASEHYRRTPPGCSPESRCGAVTWPAQDEPELTLATGPNGEAMMVPTGRLVSRAQDDPYCPEHGGCPEPPPQPLGQGELEQARALYASLLARYEATGTLPPGVDASTWQEIEAAGQRLLSLDAGHPAAIAAVPDMTEATLAASDERSRIVQPDTAEEPS